MKILIHLTALSVLLCSCSISSKTTLKGAGGRKSYNDTLQETTCEQMLLNLVRLRYSDIPYFLDVNTVTSQYNYTSTVNPIFYIPGFTNKNPFELGGETRWSNQPTIQYTPLEGQSFATQLLRPIDILTIQHLVLSGWDVDRVFKLTIQSFDNIHNAPNAAGPVPDCIPNYKTFYKLVGLMREFQSKGELYIGTSMNTEVTSTSSDSENTFESNSMRVLFPSSGENAETLAQMLTGIRKKNGRYILDLDLGFEQDAGIGIMPRSILGCMYYLSLGVVVPDKDMQLGNVAKVCDEECRSFNWQSMMKGLMTINHKQHYPSNAFVAVKYRDTWFYIDNADIPSKRTFVLLMQLYNLQSSEVRQLPPLLTIPISAGAG